MTKKLHDFLMFKYCANTHIIIYEVPKIISITGLDNYFFNLI